MIAELSLPLSVLAASLLGSVHCAAMCGGFVCLYAGERRGMASHLAYNGGRLASYLLVGLLAGLVGSTLDGVGVLAGVHRVAALVSGAMLVMWGLSMALTALGIARARASGIASFAARRLRPLVARTRGASPIARAGAIGLLSALLPCGWLYAFVATAAGTGSIRGAMGVMFVFWLGTLPAMLAVGAGLQRLTGRMRTRLPLVTAVAVVVIGALSMVGRFSSMTASSPSHLHRVR